MRKLIILATLIMTATSYGQLSDIEKAGDAHVNLLKNPGFESSVSDWTISGGALIADSSELFGNGAAQFNASGGMQYMQGSAVVPKGLFGKACRAKIEYDYSNGASVAGDYQVYVYNVTQAAALTTPVDLTVTTATSTGKAHVGFTCPNVADEIAIRIASCDACADEPSIILDAAWLGGDYLLSAVNDQAEVILLAKYPFNTNCVFERSSAGYGTPSDPGGDCLSLTTQFLASGVTVDTTDNDDYDLNFTELPEGRYYVEATFSSNNTITGTHRFRITDGTTSSPNQNHSQLNTDNHIFNINYVFDHDGGSVLYRVQAERDANTLRIFSDTVNREATWKVIRFPTQSPRDTVTLDTQGFYGHLEYYKTNGGNVLQSGAAQTRYKFPEDSLGTVVALPNNEAEFEALCGDPAENPSGGAVCGGDLEVVGFTWKNIPYTGDWELCTDFSWQADLNATSDVALVSYNLFRVDPEVVGLPSSADQLKVLDGEGSAVRVRADGSASDTTSVGIPVNICRIFTLDAGEASFAVGYTQNVIGVNPQIITSNNALPDNSAKVSVRFEIRPYTQNFPQAVALTSMAGMIGVTDGSDADAGRVGEYIENEATGISVANAGGVDITSVNLTPGDWDCVGRCYGTGGTSDRLIRCSINENSATLQSVNSQFRMDGYYKSGPGSGGTMLGPVRVNITVADEYFLVMDTDNATTITGRGSLRCRRMR